jgi:hypothetical protein
MDVAVKLWLFRRDCNSEEHERELQRCASKEKFAIAEKARTHKVSDGGWSNSVEGAGDRISRLCSGAVRLLPKMQVTEGAERALLLFEESRSLLLMLLLHSTTGVLRAG